MKRLIVAVIASVLVFALCVYLFIPNNIDIKNAVIVNSNSPALQRNIADIENWGKWWPGQKTSGKLVLNGRAYSIKHNITNQLFIGITSSSFTVTSSLSFTTISRDSSNIRLYTKIPTSYNPIKRLSTYFTGRQLKQDLDILLKSLQSYYSSTANLYGLDIKREKVKDSSLVFTSAIFKTYPTTEEVYGLVNKLHSYIDNQSAKSTDSPMLNIRRSGSADYITKVAIPVDKVLPGKGDIFYKWMLPNGNILTADVRGGSTKVDSAFACMETYVEDNYMNSPAIPYYSLITNRLAERDSNKWITRIYYPIIF